jgi:hypothetical protein
MHMVIVGWWWIWIEINDMIMQSTPNDWQSDVCMDALSKETDENSANIDERKGPSGNCSNATKMTRRPNNTMDHMRVYQRALSKVSYSTVHRSIDFDDEDGVLIYDDGINGAFNKPFDT